MAFDWISFLEDRGIPYADSGANVSAGNIVTHCPMCGNADSGQHMSISIDGRGWRCFRDHSHAGKSAARLVQALIGCSWQQAHDIVGTTAFLPGADEFADRVRKALSSEQSTPREPLKFLTEFRAITESPVLRPYWQYLASRTGGFSREAISTLTNRYGLRVATLGPFQGRIIFPVYAGKELVSWTGRTISKTNPIRYKSLSDDPDKSKASGLPCALGPISDYLLFERRLRKTNAETIYLCEGPFDALRLCVLGRAVGVVSTCFFTSSPSYAQVSRLHELLPRFKRRILLLDNGMVSQTLKTLATLSALDVVSIKMPRGVKDPGDISEAQFMKMHNRSLKL